jgi:hypothetical protein
MSETKELTVPERAAVALKSSEHEENLRALVLSTADIKVVNSKAGRDQVHAAGMVLLKSRTGLVAVSESAVEDAKAFTKAVKAEVARLLEISEAEEKRLFALRDAWDAEVAAEKAAKLAVEKARVDLIRRMIDEIKTCPAECIGRSAVEIQGAIDTMTNHEIALEEFMEFAGEAQMAKVAALAKLNDALASQEAHEAEQARIVAERAELERLRAEQAERDRLATIERQRVEDEERIARAKAQAAMLAEQQAHEARLQAERDRAAAELCAQQEAHAKLVREQQAEIDRQQAEIDAARAEQERKEREAREAVEAAELAETERVAAEQSAAAQEEADRVFAEQQRVETERRAAEAEQLRRAQIQFETIGPDADEILSVLASHYDVSNEVARHWLGRHAWMEKAA